MSTRRDGPHLQVDRSGGIINTDYQWPPMSLTRGTYVIMNDIDCPKAKLVAVLARYDDTYGIWHAIYLSTKTNMRASYGRNPTPLSKFGKHVEWDGGRYRVVDTGQPVTATYRDGKPRQWQDRNGDEWLDARNAALACVMKHTKQPAI